MGDLRNKIAKLERAIADKAAMEGFLRAGGWKSKPPEPRPPPICCQGCGKDYYELPTLYACQPDRWRPIQFWCEACMPQEIKADAGL